VRVLSGRLLEARLYLAYVAAIAVPGSAVPVLEEPRTAKRAVDRLPDDALKLLIEEGRRQLDRQAAELNRNQTRATTLLTLTIAELVFLFTSRAAITEHCWRVDVLWWLATALGMLAVAGCIAVTITPAVYGSISVTALSDSTDRTLAVLAEEYTLAGGAGDVTNAARLTVLRDAAWLAMVTGGLIVLLLPFSA